MGIQRFITHVLYIADLNLFSIICAILESKFRVEIEGPSLVFKKIGGETVLTGSIKRKVAMLDKHTLQSSEQAFVIVISKGLVHQRLRHIRQDRLEWMLKQNLASGILVEEGSEIKDICEHCIAGKQHRDLFPKLLNNCATEVLERIHTNVHGPPPRTILVSNTWYSL